MAKDVDLSSKEWTDVIFEGKNKEFGAYELRRQSDKRHNRAVIFVLIGLILVLIGGYFWGMYSDYRREQRELELQAQLEQQLADIAAAEAEEPEEVEEVPQAVEEPQREEALPEEILNTIKDTEISIAADEEVTEDITSKDVYDAAIANDKIAKDVFEFTGRILGEALADFASFTSPEAFVIFGGLAKSGELIMRPLRDAFERNNMPMHKGKIKILLSELKESDAAVLGASALGWEAK